MKDVDDLIKEIAQNIKEKMEYIKNHILTLENHNTELNEYINFKSIENLVEIYKNTISKFDELEFSSNYNENFTKYVDEERNNLDLYFSNNNEDFEKSISKIKNNEVNYKNIEINKEYIGYGGGGRLGMVTKKLFLMYCI